MSSNSKGVNASKTDTANMAEATKQSILKVKGLADNCKSIAGQFEI